MNFVVDKVSEDSFYSNLLLGLPDTIEQLGVTDTSLIRNSGANESDLMQWEAKNGVRLPEDLRDFYASTDGFTYSWTIMSTASRGYVCFENDEPIDNEVNGTIKINSLEQLSQLHGYTTTNNPEVVVNQQKQYVLKLGPESKIFVLNEIEGGSYTVLVYLNTRYVPTIWLCTEKLQFHFLTDSFTTYLRMAIAHLGIPGWQYAFTPKGVSELCAELFQVFIPHIFPLESRHASGVQKCSDDDFPDVPLNEIDSDIFQHKNTSQAIGSNLVDLNMPYSTKKCEKKKLKHNVPAKVVKRKPLYYIKQYPQQ